MTPIPIPNCPQPETPIRDRAWTDEQLEAIQDLLELVEDEHGGDHTEADCRHCRAANLLAAIGATPVPKNGTSALLRAQARIKELEAELPHPARSGGVSDADVDATCRAYIAADRFLLDGAVESMREPMRAALTHFASQSAEAVRDGVVLDCYSAGILNDFGGGNVGWWQDYIRAELERAHDFYQSQIDSLQEQSHD